MKISIAGADELTDETLDVPDIDRGIRSRPIRKRGFYRALKRKKFWAVYELSMRDMMRDLSKQIFSDQLKPNEMLLLCGLSDVTEGVK